jgi:hypothetical protein
MKTSELIDAQLDWAVAMSEGFQPVYTNGSILPVFRKCEAVENTIRGYSTDWAQGGPIIERESIEVKKGKPLYFPQGNEQGNYYEPLWISGKQHGQTPLIAAMRCFVASKLGDEVDIPKELENV